MSVLADFLGDWSLDRQITDHRARNTARFEGHARFSPDPRGLAYTESGLLTLPGTPPLEADRSYLWREAAGLIGVDHGDGRSFHRFDPARPDASHSCPPDSYQVSYDFSRWPKALCV